MREAGDAVAVVRPRGRLDGRTAPRLRLELLRAAAEEPALMVCDLSEGVADLVALGVLAPVTRTVRQWPGCPLVVVSADEAVREALSGQPGVVVARNMDRVPRPPGRPPEDRAGLRLRPTLHAPGVARRFLTAVFQSWGLLDDVAVGALVLGELVTNVVLHAGTEAEISLGRRPAGLAIAVGDFSPLPVRRRRPTALDDSGHGLLLVEALSDGWGVLPRQPEGKVVWVVLSRLTGT